MGGGGGYLCDLGNGDFRYYPNGWDDIPLPVDDSTVWSYQDSTRVTRQGGNNWSWSGRMVRSGMMRVDVWGRGFSGGPENLSQSITVTARQWSWSLGNGITAQEVTNGSLDGCFSDVDDNGDLVLGVTVGSNCAVMKYALAPYHTAAISNGSGLSWQAISDGGPNDGLSYVTSISTTLDIRWLLAPRLRSNASPLQVFSGDAALQKCGNTTSRNIATANQCFNSDLGSVIATTLLHEEWHSELAIAAALSTAGNLYARWEEIVGEDDAGMKPQAQGVFIDVFNEIQSKSAVADSPGGPQSPNYTWLDNVGSGWSLRIGRIRSRIP